MDKKVIVCQGLDNVFLDILFLGQTASGISAADNSSYSAESCIKDDTSHVRKIS